MPEQQLVKVALRNIFGIGPFKSSKICDQLQIHPKCTIGQLSEKQISTIAKTIENDPDKVGHELQRKIGQRILHLHNIKTYRGDRLARGLPAHNQKTNTNAVNAKKRHGQFVKLTPHPIQNI